MTAKPKSSRAAASAAMAPGPHAYAYIFGKSAVDQPDASDTATQPLGAVCSSTPEEALSARASSEFVWVHVDSTQVGVGDWLAKAGLPPAAVRALAATESRPRYEPLPGGAIINLRGRQAGMGDEGGGELASIRLWVSKGFVCSASMRPLRALILVRGAMEAGRIADPGDLVAAVADAITEDLDPVVAALGDQVDEVEAAGHPLRNIVAVRRQIGRARAQAIAYHRFLAPQSQALHRLASLQTLWLSEEDRLHINEANDRVARMGEEVEAIRERAALVHEQLGDWRTEQIDRRTLVLSIVAMIFLPLTFLTGLMGMNVGGIPFAHHPWGFASVCALCLAVAAGVVLFFSRAHWWPEA